MSSASRRPSSCGMFPGIKQGNESPFRCTIAAAESTADGLYRFREGTNSPRMRRSQSVIAKYEWNPLILGSLVGSGSGPTTSRSLVASVCTKLGGQLPFVCTALDRLCELGPLSFAHVPPIRHIGTASAGDEGSDATHSELAVRPPGTARVRLHPLEPLSFACVLTTMPLAGSASADRGADVLRLGIS